DLAGFRQYSWSESSDCESGGSARFRCALRGRGQKHREARPMAVRLVMALNRDRAAVFFRELLGQPQPQPRPQIRLGGKEGFKDLAQVLGWDARTIVLDHRHHARAVGHSMPAGGNTYRSLFAYRLHRIGKQVREYLPD